jgi:hypothetical protein
MASAFRTRIVLGLAGALAIATQVLAQTEIRLQAPVRNPLDQFGSSVSISQERAVIGTPFDDTGKAYLFEREDSTGLWPLSAYLLGYIQAGDEFGHAVAVDGDWAVVGAPNDDTGGSNVGAAHVFELGDGDIIFASCKIQADALASSDHFGSSVAISGDYIMVGEPDDDYPAWPWDIDNAGKVHFFERNLDADWVRVTSRWANDAQLGAKFGHSVSISGEWAIAGAPYQDPPFMADAGAAYIFRRDGAANWTQAVRLMPAHWPFDNFGYSVAIDGNRAIVGAPFYDYDMWNLDWGAAYVYEFYDGGWHQVAILTAGDASDYNLFGTAVAIQGDKALVGTPMESGQGIWSGAAYLFERDASGNWNQIAKIRPHDNDQFDQFGRSVSVYGKRLLAGAPVKEGGAGVAYIFDYQCSVLSLAAGGQTPCDPSSNTYTQDVTVTFMNPPATGGLWVNGQTFYPGASPRTVKLTGLISNGLPVDVTAFFVQATACSLTEQALFTAPTDCMPPTITCPSAITADNEPGVCGAEVTYEVPVGTDNLPGAITERTAGLGSGAFFPVGSTTEQYTVTDVAGNTASCGFAVAVVDAESPVIVCPGDIIAGNDPGVCEAVVTYVPPVGNDNCPGAVTEHVGGLGSGAAFPVGTTTEEYEVTDATGKTAGCSFSVSVVDSEPPVITTIPEPIELWPPNHKYRSLDVSMFVLSVEDNCSGTIDVSEVIVTCVDSDEPENEPGDEDGNTLEDMLVSADCKSARLRGERDETRNGRVYTFHLSVADDYGNVGQAIYEIGVPIDQGGAIAVDNGPAYTVHGTCGTLLARTGDTEIAEGRKPLQQPVAPQEFRLMQNHPNPLGSTTLIQYDLPEAQFVTVRVHDVFGHEVATLVREREEAGRHGITFDSSGLASGVYFYEITAGDFHDVKKMVITR